MCVCCDDDARCVSSEEDNIYITYIYIYGVFVFFFFLSDLDAPSLYIYYGCSIQQHTQTTSEILCCCVEKMGGVRDFLPNVFF